GRRFRAKCGHDPSLDSALLERRRRNTYSRHDQCRAGSREYEVQEFPTSARTKSRHFVDDVQPIPAAFLAELCQAPTAFLSFASLSRRSHEASEILADVHGDRRPRSSYHGL